MNNMGKVIDLLPRNYKNFLMMGYFNAQEADFSVKDFDSC